MKNSKVKYINLKNHVFVEYDLVFRKVDGFKNNNLTDLKFKNRILFIRFKNLSQQYNLMYVDTYFPLIIGDICLEALVNKSISITDYVDSVSRQNILAGFTNDELKIKFKQWIYFLVYGNLHLKKSVYPEYDIYKIYYDKENNEIIFYEFFKYNELYPIVFDRLRFQIIYEKTKIGRRNIHLRMRVGITGSLDN